MPETLLVATGEQARARRRTIRTAHVTVGEAHAGCGQRVEVRSRDILAAVKAHVGVTHVVADDHEEVGSRGGGELAGARGGQREEEDEYFHGKFWWAKIKLSPRARLRAT